MKGFARILETIIAAIIILTSLSFFLPITIKQSSWDNALLEMRAQDAISAGYKSGNIAPYIKNNDNTSLRNFLEKLFTKSTDFSVQINGIPNPVIFVGFVCDDPNDAVCTSRLEDVKSRLSPLTFPYKGRNIEIRAERIIVTATSEANIMLFTTTAELNNKYTNNKNEIDRFLENGGTLLLIGDLRQSDVSPSGSELTFLMRNIFNITWNSNDNNPPDNGDFKDYDNPERITYNIAKYYTNISGRSAQNVNFKKFNTDGENINKIAVSDRTVIQSSNNKFAFVSGNKNVINGNGRAIWLAENDKSEDMKNLTKAVAMWASGEKYRMDGAVKKTPPQVSQSANIIIQDTDTYEFKLTTWNVF